MRGEAADAAKLRCLFSSRHHAQACQREQVLIHPSLVQHYFWPSSHATFSPLRLRRTGLARSGQWRMGQIVYRGFVGSPLLNPAGRLAHWLLGWRYRASHRGNFHVDLTLSSQHRCVISPPLHPSLSCTPFTSHLELYGHLPELPPRGRRLQTLSFFSYPPCRPPPSRSYCQGTIMF